MIFLLTDNYSFGSSIYRMAKTDAEIAFLKQTFGDVEAIKKLSEQPKEDAPPVEDIKEEVPEAAAIPESPLPAIETAKTEMSDEELIELINKRKGISLKSFDELIPKEDPAIAAERREAKKMAFAFEKGLIKKSEYENYISDLNKKEAIVFSDFAQYAKEVDPELSDEEIKDEFNDLYGRNADEGSSKYKIGQRKIEQLSETLLKKKYASYFDIDNKFSQYESELSKKEQEDKNILAQAPLFKESVEEAVKTFSKMTFAVDDKTSYEVELPADVLDSIKKSFLDKDFVVDRIKSGMGKDEIKGALEIAVLKQSFPTILKTIINKDRLEYAKSLQGVPSTFSLKTEATPNKKVFSDKEKEYLKKSGLPIPESTN